MLTGQQYHLHLAIKLVLRPATTATKRKASLRQPLPLSNVTVRVAAVLAIKATAVIVVK